MKRVLEVRRGAARIGVLNFTKNGNATLRYADSFLAQRAGGRAGVSCSLPVSNTARSATAWCRGLLPEGDALRSLAADLGVAASDTYALLRRHGRDVAGAFEIVEPSTSQRREARLEPYSPSALISDVAAVASGELPLGIRDDTELSLAGVQNKLLLVASEEGWARPLHGFPSTHLIKTDHPIHRGIVDAEDAALAFARRLGLSAAQSQLLTVGDVRCIIVQRFDRSDQNGVIERLHQEDLLQALGVDPTANSGRSKYQNNNVGPPSLWHLAEVLRRFGSDEQLLVLLTFVVFNTLIGNGDAHAKNFSIFIDGDGSVRLTPLYDTVPTLLWPALRDRNALWVGDEPVLSHTTVVNLLDEAVRWGVDRSLAAEILETLGSAVLSAIDSITHEGLRGLVRANVERIGLGS